jgi:cyclophilin family peptidyl-prolyl cis-trans isomerase
MQKLALAGFLFSAAALNVPAVGQSQPASTQSDQAQVDQGQKSEADKAFEPLAKRFKNLYESLRSLGGLTEENTHFVSALRDEVRQFAQQFPNDLRGPATELTLSSWLKDTARLEQLYADLLRIAPEKHEIRIAWADRLKAQNRYGEAVDVLKAGNFDPAKTPQAFIALSDYLFAENRFQEALDALNAIPQDVLTAQIQLKNQVEAVKKDREEYIKLWQLEESLRAQEEAADDLPRALIKTPRGSIEVELFENHAPNTVANFIKLADEGFYTGTKFHRVMPNFMAQGGDPNSKEGATTGNPGEGGPGYTIPDEHLKDDHRKHFAGSLAMAKTGAPNTGGSQFYLSHAPTPWLNGMHTVFGRIINGLDVARAIKQDDVIESITVLRKRDHQYIPNTLPLATPTTQPGIPGLEFENEGAPPSAPPTGKAPEEGDEADGDGADDGDGDETDGEPSTPAPGTP